MLAHLVRLVVAHVVDRDVPLDRECPCGLGSGEKFLPNDRAGDRRIHPEIRLALLPSG